LQTSKKKKKSRGITNGEICKILASRVNFLEIYAGLGLWEIAEALSRVLVADRAKLRFRSG